MKTLKPSDFPEMQRVFAGYLHEDFLDEYGTPLAASGRFMTTPTPPNVGVFPQRRNDFSNERPRLISTSCVL